MDLCVCASGVEIPRSCWFSKGQLRRFSRVIRGQLAHLQPRLIPVKEQRQLYSREVKGPQQCEVQIMSHYQKLTAVVMGHLRADDGSGNRFSTSGHIVITSLMTESVSTSKQLVLISKDK